MPIAERERNYQCPSHGNYNPVPSEKRKRYRAPTITCGCTANVKVSSFANGTLEVNWFWKHEGHSESACLKVILGRSDFAQFRDRSVRKMKVLNHQWLNGERHRNRKSLVPQSTSPLSLACPPRTQRRHRQARARNPRRQRILWLLSWRTEARAKLVQGLII